MQLFDRNKNRGKEHVWQGATRQEVCLSELGGNLGANGSACLECDGEISCKSGVLLFVAGGVVEKEGGFMLSTTSVREKVCVWWRRRRRRRRRFSVSCTTFINKSCPVIEIH